MNDMIDMRAVVLRDGTERQVRLDPGLSLMEVLRNSGVDELLALCGGCCSCATCHVYLEGGSGTVEAIGEDERDLLSTSDHIREKSRLSCQVAADQVPPGARIIIAPED